MPARWLCTALVLASSVRGAGAQTRPTSCLYTDPRPEAGGKSVDFGELWTEQGTQVSTPVGDFLVNPCGSVTCPGITKPLKSSCCLTTKDGMVNSCAGTLMHKFTPQLAYAMPKNFVVGYIATQGGACQALQPPLGPKLQMTVAFQCDPLALPPPAAQKLTYVKNVYLSVECNVNLTWSTSVVCTLPPPPERFGAAHYFGMVFSLTFFLGFGTYCIGGFVVLKFVMRKRGNAAIPNYDFWAGLPALIIDGVGYASGKRSTYTEVKTEAEAPAEGTPSARSARRGKRGSASPGANVE